MLRARPDRLRGRAQAGPGDRSPCSAPDDAAPGHRDRRRQDPDPGARHRPEGRPADHPRAQGPDRRRRSAAPPGSDRRSRRRPWRDQVQQGLVGLGWSAKEADAPSRRSRPRPASPPDVARAAARRPPHAEQGLSVHEPNWTTRRPTTARPGDARRALDRRRGRRRRAGRRGGAAAPHPRRGRRPGRASATSSGWCSRRPARRGRAPDHVLLSGPPGLGKTTLAMIIAAEMSTPLRLTSGPAITHAGDLAAILSGLNDGDVLFVDEIHRMSRPAEEMLYLAMEDFRVDVVIGKGPGATAIPLEIPPFTLVGATTRAGLLPGPLRDRFGFTAPPGVLRGRRARPDRPPLRRAARRRRSTTTAPPRSPRARAARRASPTGCCAGSATTPRCAADGVVTRDVARGRAGAATRSTSSASTGSTAPCSTSLCRRFGGGPVGRLARWRSPSARSARRSRRSPSRSWSGRGSWRAPRAAGSPRPRPGTTSA